MSSGSAFNISENTPGTLVSQLENGVYGAIFSFSGLIDVVTGQTSTSIHDDGISLAIGGVNLGFYSCLIGAYSETKTYTGASGIQAFRLIYADCCGGGSGDAAVLRIALLNTVPEPAALALMGLGFLWMPRLSRRLVSNTTPENK